MSSHRQMVYVILVLCVVVATANAQFQMHAARSLVMAEPIKAEVFYNGRKRVSSMNFVQTETVNQKRNVAMESLRLD